MHDGCQAGSSNKEDGGCLVRPPPPLLVQSESCVLCCRWCLNVDERHAVNSELACAEMQRSAAAPTADTRNGHRPRSIVIRKSGDCRTDVSSETATLPRHVVL